MTEKRYNEEVYRRNESFREQRFAEGDQTGWFEDVYAAAESEREIPWAKLAPNRLLCSWPQWPLKGEGKKALVIGCGLGDDAVEIHNAGWDVTAFDISETAVAWCRNRFPNAGINWQVADLFHLPENWKSAYPFVLESMTLQSLPARLRPPAMKAIAGTLAPGGDLLVLCFGLKPEENPEEGPPWPLQKDELEHFSELGLQQQSFEEIQITSSRKRPGPRYRALYSCPE